MTEKKQLHLGEQDDLRHAVKRRGLIAGAAALVAGMVAKKTSQPVAGFVQNDSFIATGGGSYGFYNIGNFPYNNGVRVSGTDAGVYGYGAGTGDAIGVQGLGLNAGSGVQGNGGGTSGIGVKGVGGDPNGIGVQGNGTGTAPGVYGVSSSGTKGVHGQHTGSGYGVYGQAGTGGIGVGGDAGDVGVLGRSGGDTSGNTTGFPIGVRGSIPNTGYGVYGNAGSGYGVYGNAAGGGGVGVGGVAANGSGVQGTSNTGSTTKGVYGKHLTNGYGVYGDAGDGGYGVTGIATTALGVLGASTSGTGVYGQSTSGTGVYGVILSGSAPGTIAISGNNAATAANSHGIVGVATVGHGLVGTTNFVGAGPPYYAGLVGNATHGAYAGLFFGNVSVTGTLNGHTAIMQQAQIAVAHPDGTHRLTHSVSATDAWLEDVGEGSLTNGQVAVKIAPDFAAVADVSKYHVFLTAHGNYHLHVAEMKADGFVVGVTDGGGSAQPTGGAPVPGSQVAKASNVAGTFSWRVMAKRKDGQTARLAAYTFPNLTPPHIPDLPPSEPPKKP